MIKIRVLSLALIPTLVAVGNVLAQDSRLAARVDAETQRGVEALAASARAQQLPTEPLFDKALEGASKGAPGDQIVQAVARLLDDLAAAREMLGEDATDSELLAGAGAVRAGAAPGYITALAEVRSSSSVMVPLAVLTDLIALGVPPDTAAVAVATLAQSGATDAELEDLLRKVGSDIQAGYPPVQAASIRSGVPTSVPPPAPPVLIELASPVRDP